MSEIFLNDIPAYYRPQIRPQSVTYKCQYILLYLWSWKTWLIIRSAIVTNKWLKLKLNPPKGVVTLHPRNLGKTKNVGREPVMWIVNRPWNSGPTFLTDVRLRQNKIMATYCAEHFDKTSVAWAYLVVRTDSLARRNRRGWKVLWDSGDGENNCSGTTADMWEILRNDRANVAIFNFYGASQQQLNPPGSVKMHKLGCMITNNGLLLLRLHTFSLQHWWVNTLSTDLQYEMGRKQIFVWTGGCACDFCPRAGLKFEPPSHRCMSGQGWSSNKRAAR